jgi:hypothetical protein
MSKTYKELLKERNELSPEDRKELSLKLDQELVHIPGLVDYVDIITDAPCLFKMVVKEIESLPRHNSARQKLALDFLTAVYKSNPASITSHGVEYCAAGKSGSKTFTIDYDKVKEYYKEDNSTSVGTWRILYLMQNSIYVKQEREVSDWYSAVKFMCDNCGSETFLVTNIPGVTFNSKGVCHDKFCATGGTKDADFLYRGKTAEFKMATKSVKALAEYAYKHPEYIYNASFLFTCESDREQYYLVDYTKPSDYTEFTITKIEDITEEYFTEDTSSKPSRRQFTIE